VDILGSIRLLPAAGTAGPAGRERIPRLCRERPAPERRRRSSPAGYRWRCLRRPSEWTSTGTACEKSPPHDVHLGQNTGRTHDEVGGGVDRGRVTGPVCRTAVAARVSLR